jgi:hypothetical protein
MRESISHNETNLIFFFDEISWRKRDHEINNIPGENHVNIELEQVGNTVYMNLYTYQQSSR